MALTNARRTDPEYGTHPISAKIMLYRGRLVADLAAALGADPTLITVTADPDRAERGYHAQLLTVTDSSSGAVYRFTPVVGFDTGPLFHLLGPCQSCRAEVPVATISTLADLGYYLTTHRAPHTTTDAHRCDPHHRPDCPHANH